MTTEYEPELKRTLGAFQVFAISFAFISVAVGIFATYDDVLRNAGPVGIWLWPVVAVGQTLIALVIAQFAARIPLSGSSYQWASRLASPKVGWLFGWMSFCYLAIGVVTVDNAMATTALMPLLNMAPDENTARVLTLVVLLVQTVLVVFSTRLVGLITSGTVGLELVIVVVLTIALLIAAAVTGHGSWGNLASRGVADGAPGYFAIGGGLMFAMVMGIVTLVGFDSAANMAEEADDPFRTVPRAIVGSVVAAGVLGMVFAIALTVAIPDIPQISASETPVALILRDQLGPVVERLLLAAMVLAFFGAGLVTQTTCARVVYAMARDGRFPASRLMHRVHPRTQTPIPATALTVVVGFVLMLVLPGAALQQLITAGGVIGAVLYGAIVVLYLGVRKRLVHKHDAFDLGRFETPVALAAVVWSIIVVLVLVTPPEVFVAVMTAVGILLAGIAYFGFLLLSNRLH